MVRLYTDYGLNPRNNILPNNAMLAWRESEAGREVVTLKGGLSPPCVPTGTQTPPPARQSADWIEWLVCAVKLPSSPDFSPSRSDSGFQSGGVK